MLLTCSDIQFIHSVSPFYPDFAVLSFPDIFLPASKRHTLPLSVLIISMQLLLSGIFWRSTRQDITAASQRLLSPGMTPSGKLSDIWSDIIWHWLILLTESKFNAEAGAKFMVICRNERTIREPFERDPRKKIPNYRSFQKNGNSPFPEKTRNWSPS